MKPEGEPKGLPFRAGGRSLLFDLFYPSKNPAFAAIIEGMLSEQTPFTPQTLKDFQISKFADPAQKGFETAQQTTVKQITIDLEIMVAMGLIDKQDDGFKPTPKGLEFFELTLSDQKGK